MMEERENRPRIGCIDGQARRINERVIDDQWTQYLDDYSDLVRISPLKFFQLFGGSVRHFTRGLPTTLQALADGLAELCRTKQIRTLYVNMPMLTPYLLMARNIGKIDLGFLFVAHSVGSEYWLKHWLGIAPFLTERDVLLTSTESCKQALCNISPVYEQAVTLPLCIRMVEQLPAQRKDHPDRLELFSISRIEDVKNIHVLLTCFAQVRQKLPHVHLTLAGEYTGRDEQQVAEYRERLTLLLHELELAEHVTWTGSIDEQVKQELFRRADVMLNLSTDPGETFGYNLIEAKTHGVPVVCTGWDGFREIVQHGVDGFWVDVDWSGDQPVIDESQVVSYVLELLEQPNLRAQFSAQALQNAEAYDYNRIMPQIVAAVQERTFASNNSDVRFSEQATHAALTPCSEQIALYRLEKLQALSFLKEAPIHLIATASDTPLVDWYPQCKPIIDHFARRWRG